MFSLCYAPVCQIHYASMHSSPNPFFQTKSILSQCIISKCLITIIYLSVDNINTSVPSNYTLHKPLSGPLLKYLNVYSVPREETPDMNKFCLTKSTKSSNCLSFARGVYLLRRGKERTEENRMVSPCQVRTAGALVHHVQQKYAFHRTILELF